MKRKLLRQELAATWVVVSEVVATSVVAPAVLVVALASGLASDEHAKGVVEFSFVGTSSLEEELSTTRAESPVAVLSVALTLTAAFTGAAAVPVLEAEAALALGCGVAGGVGLTWGAIVVVDDELLVLPLALSSGLGSCNGCSGGCGITCGAVTLGASCLRKFSCACSALRIDSSTDRSPSST